MASCFFVKAKASVLPQHTIFRAPLPRNDNKPHSLNRFRLIHWLGPLRQNRRFIFLMLAPKHLTRTAVHPLLRLLSLVAFEQSCRPLCLEQANCSTHSSSTARRCA